MHPTLFTIASFPVPSYGMMLALSFLFGIFFAVFLAKRRGLDSDAIADLGLYVIISAVVGARLYYVMTHFDEFSGNLFSIINPIQDGRLGCRGLVMYGGFIAAIVTAAVYFKIRKLPLLPYLDACSPSVGIGIALTRVGCFLNGCCYGAAAKAGSLLSINYPKGSPAGYYQRLIGADGLFPSQFLESAGGIAIFIILLLVGRSKFYFSGLQFYLLIISYAVLRFFVEMTRYIETTKIGPFSHNQIICMALFSAFGYVVVKKVWDVKSQSLKEKSKSKSLKSNSYGDGGCPRNAPPKTDNEKKES